MLLDFITTSRALSRIGSVSPQTAREAGKKNQDKEANTVNSKQS